MSHIVSMLEFSFYNVSDNLHVTVGVKAKAFAGLNHIVIKDTQRPPVHVVGIVVFIEGKMPPCIEPAAVGVVALIGLDDLNHVQSPLLGIVF